MPLPLPAAHQNIKKKNSCLFSTKVLKLLLLLFFCFLLPPSRPPSFRLHRRAVTAVIAARRRLLRSASQGFVLCCFFFVVVVVCRFAGSLGYAWAGNTGISSEPSASRRRRGSGVRRGAAGPRSLGASQRGTDYRSGTPDR